MSTINHNLIAPEQEKFQAMVAVIGACAQKFRATFDVIASEHDTSEVMFDVIVNEVKKYSPNARKL